MILVVASLIVKVIGALYKIPLKNYIGGEVMGLFSIAYQIYNVMLVISTVGLPIALSKMVAESVALGKTREVRRIVGVGAAIFVPIGAACTMLLLAFAGPIATAFGNEEAAFAIRAIAPSVLLVTIISVFRGYYQGMSNMVPTAISQVIEALCKLGVGLALAFYAMNTGMDVPYIAAFAIVGVTVGEIISALYLILRSVFSRQEQRVHALSDSVKPVGSLLRSLLVLAVPVTISNSITSITFLIDSGLVINRLRDIGMTKQAATELYGIYNTMPLSLWNLPQTIIVALTVSVIPAIAGAYAAQNFTKAAKTIGTSLRVGVLIALPCGAGFLALAGPILRLLFREDTVTATPMLQILGLSVPFVAIVALTNAVLQGMGRADLSFINMFLGALVKIVSEYALIGSPTVMVLGAPISTVLCYAVIAVVNLLQIRRLSRALPPLGGLVLKPLAAAVGMGACAYSLHLLLGGLIGDKAATLLAVGAGAVVYGMLLLALRAISREDALLLPKGEKIADILHLK